MANIFEGAIGSNNTAGLTAFPESPDSDGIYFPRDFTPVSGLVQNDGFPCILLRFPDIMDEAVAEATLTILGLQSLSMRSRRVTVRLPANVAMTSWQPYNGIAQRVVPGRTISHAYCWYERPQILVCRLEAI